MRWSVSNICGVFFFWIQDSICNDEEIIQCLAIIKKTIELNAQTEKMWKKMRGKNKCQSVAGESLERGIVIDFFS